ncbi:mRNA-decapping enzyme 1A [Geranomyces variabilis]|nr:mRNA-decapping enzyme 1A [Geranomyces variabilis]
MDPAARLAVNLNVLRRHDPTIVSILDSSSHVVVYDFDPETKSWTKKGIEGTMFIFQRSKLPFYGLFVMNRLALENLMVLLNADMEVQLLQEFVIYRQPDDSVQGLWMYETVDRARIVKTLTTYTELCSQSTPAQLPPPHLAATPLPPSAQAPMSVTGTANEQHHQPVDLLAMLHRAKVVAPNGGGGSNVSGNGSDSSNSAIQYQHQQRPQQPQHLNGGSPQRGSTPINSPGRPQPHQQLQHSQLPPNGNAAPPITPQQRQIQRLEDIWQWVEDLGPLRNKGGLADKEFRRRMVHLAQDTNFLDAMYRSYRWERPT